MGSIYIGLAIVDLEVVPKLNEKHNITEADVKEALQWPAEVRTALEDSAEYGLRWIAHAILFNGHPILAWLDPVPVWEGERADTWRVRSAYWV